MSGTEFDSHRAAPGLKHVLPDHELPNHELIAGATTQALRLRDLQHAAAVEWLDAEATLRATESELAAPPPLPAPTPLASDAECGIALAKSGKELATRSSREPWIAATALLILAVGAGLVLYEPAIASLSQDSDGSRPVMVAPATNSESVTTVVPGLASEAIRAHPRDGAGTPALSDAAVPDDFGARIYGRFAAAPAREMACLARAIYYEARGEGYDGKVAVAQVVLNRARSKKWPSTICGVVHQGEARGEKCQFSYVCFDHLSQPSGELWDEAQTIAELAIAGRVYLRELEHATHYHTTAVKPVWRERLQTIATIGAHIFYSEPGGVRASPAEDGRYQSAVAAAAVANSVKPKPKTSAATRSATVSTANPLVADPSSDTVVPTAPSTTTPAPPRKAAKAVRPKSADPDTGAETDTGDLAAPIFRH